MDRKIGVGEFVPNAYTYQYINDVLSSGRVSYGPFSKRLESEFSDMHGAMFGVLSSSGTSSLQIALQAMKEVHGWGDGDEVIVPAVTFVATINIILHNNMKPVLVDVDPRTYNMAVSKVEAAITERTRAIIPVHLFGQPACMTRIMDIADRHNLRVIEDSCETMLARHNGKSVGSIGDIGCFSMYVAHILTAGVGGIAITNNPDYAVVMRSLVNHGRDNIYIAIDDDEVSDSAKMREIVARRFNFERVGHSARITEFEAAVAVSQLTELDAQVAIRQSNAEFLTDLLAPLRQKLQLPYISQSNTHSFMMYPIVIRDGDKWPLCIYLENAGVETRELMPITNQPVYRELFDENEYPVAKWINDGGFYVGCHHGLTYDDMFYIADTIKRFYDEC